MDLVGISSLSKANSTAVNLVSEYPVTNPEVIAASVAAMKTSRTSIIVLGDSNTNPGYGCDSKYQHNWAFLFTRGMQELLKRPGGFGFAPFCVMSGSAGATAWTSRLGTAISSDNVTLVGTAAYNGQWIAAPGMSVMRGTAGTATSITQTIGEAIGTSNQITILGLNQGGGTIGITVNGPGTTDSVASTSGAETVFTKSLTFTVGTGTSVTIAFSSGSTWTSGCIYDRSDLDGPTLFNFAHHGRRLVDDGTSATGFYRANNSNGITNNIATYSSRTPAMVIVPTWQNDAASSSVDLVTFEAGMQAIVTRAIAVGTRVVFINSLKPHVLDNNPASYSTQRRIVASLAAANPTVVAVIDEAFAFDFWGDFQNALVAGGVVNLRFDASHYNQTFHHLRASSLLKIFKKYI